MRRTLRLLLALSSTLAFIGIMAPEARALHGLPLAVNHQLLPANDLTPSMSIDGVCVVEGAVALHNVPVLNLGEHPNHGLYQFTEVSINCVDKHNPPASTLNLSGAFAVEAHGNSDGPDHTGFTLHGETAEGMGWSHNGDPTTLPPPDPTAHHYLGMNALCSFDEAGEGCGYIHVVRTIPAAPAVGSLSDLNYVKFMRNGGSVNAWGHIDWTAAAFLDVCFNANLEFVPIQWHAGDLSGLLLGYVLQATLTGTATLLVVTDHHCG